MPVTSLSPNAYLIIDNCMLVMLTDYYYERHGRGMSPMRFVPDICQWISDQLDVLATFAVDGRLHCTDRVRAEYMPLAGRLRQIRNFDRRDCGTLQQQIGSLLFQTTIDRGDLVSIRGLPQAPRRLVGPNGLSDNDLSLIVLAAQLAASGDPVYVLSNDQDLLSFIAWVRTRREARERWQQIQAVQGLHSLTYLELLHRGCDIPTDLMKDIICFALKEHYARKELSGTRKGQFIMGQLTTINDSIMQSIVIKTSHQGATA